MIAHIKNLIKDIQPSTNFTLKFTTPTEILTILNYDAGCTSEPCRIAIAFTVHSSELFHCTPPMFSPILHFNPLPKSKCISQQQTTELPLHVLSDDVPQSVTNDPRKTIYLAMQTMKMLGRF